MNSRTKRLFSLLVACLLMGSVLTACDGDGTQSQDTSANDESAVESVVTDESQTLYSVTVQDYAGEPVQDVVVTIFQGQEEVKMNVVKADGKASFKLPPADYTVSLSSPKGNFYYDTQVCKLSPASPDITITLYNQAEQKLTLWAPSPLSEEGKQQEAHLVGEGATHCELVGGGEMTYFVFVPTRGGVYEVSFVADGEADLGYYGMPINVFSTKLLDTVDNKIEIEIRNDSVNLENPQQTGQFVFGLLPAQANTTDCIFTITRVSDVEQSPVDMPWQEYQATQVKAFEGEHGSTLVDLDVTNPDLTVVFNEADGYYHYGSADGPVVFIRISSASPYLESLVKITETTRLGVYIYDEDGNFVRKESYHSMLDAYKAICDDNGVCPLTPELEYMVKQFGEANQWWDFSAGRHIFGDKIVSPENAWLFICCYYQ